MKTIKTHHCVIEIGNNHEPRGRFESIHDVQSLTWSCD